MRISNHKMDKARYHHHLIVKVKAAIIHFNHQNINKHKNHTNESKEKDNHKKLVKN